MSMKAAVDMHCKGQFYIKIKVIWDGHEMMKMMYCWCDVMCSQQE